MNVVNVLLDFHYKALLTKERLFYFVRNFVVMVEELLMSVMMEIIMIMMDVLVHVQCNQDGFVQIVAQSVGVFANKNNLNNQ